MLDNGADANLLTADNERPIDLVDQEDFPLISLLLNYMNLKNDDEDFVDLGSESTEFYQRLFCSILKSKSDIDSAICEIQVIY